MKKEHTISDDMNLVIFILMTLISIFISSIGIAINNITLTITFGIIATIVFIPVILIIRNINSK